VLGSCHRSSGPVRGRHPQGPGPAIDLRLFRSRVFDAANCAIVVAAGVFALQSRHLSRTTITSAPLMVLTGSTLGGRLNARQRVGWPRQTSS
jgi:hypothetical protein